jgi:hypothetical protein
MLKRAIAIGLLLGAPLAVSCSEEPESEMCKQLKAEVEKQKANYEGLMEEGNTFTAEKQRYYWFEAQVNYRAAGC